MAWIYLFISSFFEVVWAVSMKYTDGFTRLYPSIITVIVGLGNMWLLAKAMQSLPLGIAYPAWIGIGAVGTIIYGILFLGESISFIRLISIVLIFIGVIGLNVSNK